MKNKILTTAISSAVLAMSGHMVYADTASDLVDALVTKGVLTEEEGALLSKNDEKQKKNQPIIKNKAGKFELESADGKNTIGLTGRMHFDYRATDVRSDATGDYESNDNDAKSMNDEFEMRRARIGVKGKLAGAFDYEVVLNGVGKDTNVLDTASLNWGSYKPFQIEAGVFKQAFNLEGLTSSNDIDFNERSFINQISPHKKMGLSFHGEPTNGMTYALTKYQQSWENADARDENNYSGRLTYDFASANDMKDSIFHLGVSGFTENYAMQPASSSNGGTVTHAKFLTLTSAGRGFSPLFSMELQGDSLGTTAFSQKQKNTVNIDNKVAALEGIFAKGPFKLQAEYARGNFYGSNPMRGNNIEADMDMAYVSANWILTGEEYAKSYKGGIMKGLTPASNFDFEKGTGTGLWELGARYEMFDADDLKITQVTAPYNETRFRGTNDCHSATSSDLTSTSGQCNAGAHQYTIGLKWIANPNVLAKISYTYMKADDKFNAPDLVSAENFDSEQLLQTRIQWMF